MHGIFSSQHIERIQLQFLYTLAFQLFHEVFLDTMSHAYAIHGSYNNKPQMFLCLHAIQGMAIYSSAV